MKKVTLLTVAVVCLMLISIIGCESDSPNKSDITPGDINDPTFLFVSDSIGGFSMDIVGISLDFTFELLEGQFPSLSAGKLSNGKSASNPPIVVSHAYSYADGWHVFEFSATFIELEDTTTIEGLDSIQTLVDNLPTQTPDSTMNGMKIRNQYSLENNIFGSAVGHQSLNLNANTFDSAGVVTVSGNTNDTLDFQFAESLDSCSLKMNNNVAINNVVLQIDVEDVCPSSGSIVANQNISLNCTGGQGSALDSLNIEGSWTVSVVFHGTTETVTYTDGTTTWTVTESCGQSATAPSFSGFAYKK